MDTVIALTGGAGRLGQRVRQELERRGVRHTAPARAEVDWAKPERVRAYLPTLGPAVVVALAAFTDVARAEREPLRCVRDTVGTAQATARACARLGLPMIYLSTDYVVPLLRGTESGGVYARAKLEAERVVLEAGGLVVRMAFTTPEQVRGWGWANDYTLSNRWWVEDAASALVEYVEGRSWLAIQELGPLDALTPAQLLRQRYPRHPALDHLVITPDEMQRRVGFAAPRDTRFHWSWGANT